MSQSLDILSKQLADFSKENEAQLPPVEQWNPQLSGDIDIFIKSNGDWLHEGTVIKRQALVKLFSSILKKEQGDYFLVTPVEKWRIRVESYPLFFGQVELKTLEGVPTFELNGTLDFAVRIDSTHKLWVEANGSALLPIVHCRNGLNGVISRNAYYQIAEHSEETASGDIGIYSAGTWFSLLPVNGSKLS